MCNVPCPLTPYVYLPSTADFTIGTLIIDTPGPYRLCEDITFDPNAPTGGQSPAEAFDPDFGVYSENTYGLGYFAAIVIAADGVDLYLDGHTLEQSAGHALMQRFFANIELSSSPFLPSVGPAQFVGDDDTFVAATNVRILGPGVIGRSAHHGKSPSSMESNDATCQISRPHPVHCLPHQVSTETTMRTLRSVMSPFVTLRLLPSRSTMLTTWRSAIIL
jgi:hypothetical protein